MAGATGDGGQAGTQPGLVEDGTFLERATQDLGRQGIAGGGSHGLGGQDRAEDGNVQEGVEDPGPEQPTQPGQPLYGLETTNNGRVVNFAGGIPLMRDGEVAGAVGVSGGTVDQDQEVAEAGVAAF